MLRKIQVIITISTQNLCILKLDFTSLFHTVHFKREIPDPTKVASLAFSLPVPMPQKLQEF